MKLYLNDPRDYLTLSTEEGGATLQTNMGIIARPNGDDVKFMSLALPPDRTYLFSGGPDTDALGIYVTILPEGFTPSTFGWDETLAVKLSVLIEQLKENVT